MDYETILPVELSARMKRGEEVTLIDVREPDEYQIARIEGACFLPLSIMFRHVALHDMLHAYRIEELLLKKDWTN